jgi:hypothetical protein
VVGAGEKALQVGSNEFSIAVTAEDGSVQAYTLTVLRAQPNAIVGAAILPLQIYPNPTTGHLQFIGDAAAGLAFGRVEVYSLSGTLIYSSPITNRPSPINISHLPQGVYMVKVGNRVGKIVKK